MRQAAKTVCGITSVGRAISEIESLMQPPRP